MDFQTIDPHSNSLMGLKSSSPLSVGGYAYICNFMQLICNYMQLYATMQLMQLYATICNYIATISYATICNNMQLCNYATMQLCNYMQLYATYATYATFMQLMQLYATCNDNLSSCFNECRYHQIGICRIYLPRVMIKIY
jgi:uncharacterized membrane protein YczE